MSIIFHVPFTVYPVTESTLFKVGKTMVLQLAALAHAI